MPAGYTAVANGKFLGSQSTGSDDRFDWAMSQPMTTWLATVAVNKFSQETALTRDGKLVRIFYPAGTSAAVADGYARAANMIDYFETKIGPYPFASYGSILVKDPALYYALETQAMSTFPDDGKQPDESFVAHELAHQWFGDSVSVAKWADLWLAEGSATYFETLWPNRKSPSDFDGAMRDLYDYAVSEGLKAPVVTNRLDLFSDRTYVRGALVLYALRQTVGDPTLFLILRHFVQDNKGGNVTSEDFIRTAVSYSGNSAVRPLLAEWIYGDTIPTLPGTTVATKKSGSVPRPAIVGGCGRDGAACRQ